MNRSNPYETPPAIAGDVANTGGLNQQALLKLIAIPLLGLTFWSIHRVSPFGIVVPAAVGWSVTTFFGAPYRVGVVSVVLAYVVGIAAIVCAATATDAYDPMLLFDDEVRLAATQIWAAIGVLGALAGAAVSVLFAILWPPGNKGAYTGRGS